MCMHVAPRGIGCKHSRRRLADRAEPACRARQAGRGVPPSSHGPLADGLARDAACRFRSNEGGASSRKNGLREHSCSPAWSWAQRQTTSRANSCMTSCHQGRAFLHAAQRAPQPQDPTAPCKAPPLQAPHLRLSKASACLHRPCKEDRDGSTRSRFRQMLASQSTSRAQKQGRLWPAKA